MKTYMINNCGNKTFRDCTGRRGNNMFDPCGIEIKAVNEAEAINQLYRVYLNEYSLSDVYESFEAIELNHDIED